MEIYNSTESVKLFLRRPLALEEEALVRLVCLSSVIPRDIRPHERIWLQLNNRSAGVVWCGRAILSSSNPAPPSASRRISNSAKTKLWRSRLAFHELWAAARGGAWNRRYKRTRGLRRQPTRDAYAPGDSGSARALASFHTACESMRFSVLQR